MTNDYGDNNAGRLQNFWNIILDNCGQSPVSIRII